MLNNLNTTVIEGLLFLLSDLLYWYLGEACIEDKARSRVIKGTLWSPGANITAEPVTLTLRCPLFGAVTDDLNFIS